MSFHFDEVVIIRTLRAIVLSIAAIMLLHIQNYLNFPNWVFSIVIGIFGLMHSTRHLVILVFSILIFMVLMPPAHLEVLGRWLLALRNGSTL